jgi:hypothetical protein
MSRFITVVEVGPRDGLQNESVLLEPAEKLDFIARLEACGVKRIETVSFVNPRRVPQMAGAEEIAAALSPTMGRSRIGLVLNLKGWERAVASGCDEANVVVCASDGFGIRNQGASTAEQVETLAAIVAGSKVSTKLTILQSLARNVDQLIVGGGIANTFMLAAGLKIGKSLAEPDLVGEAKAVIEAMRARGAEVPIPTDVVCAKTFSADAVATVKKATEVDDDDLILDIGPDTAARLATQLKAAGTVVWNGPMGVFEFAAFENGTKVVAHAIAGSAAFSIAGGGDTLAAIAKYGIEKDIGYISTGGGAFLEVLEGKTLPAFEILMKRAA